MAGEEDVIQSQIAIDPDDIIRGIITMRPFNSEESKTNSLKHHVEFIARVTGIPAPDFLDNKQ